ncbi:MAG: Trm112 family protein [Candidatus Hodarchaeota archaeon]
MHLDLVDILACPVCKNHPLILYKFEMVPIPESSEEEVQEGLLNCTACKRYFPIRYTIPQLLPDYLRKEKKDKAFLQKYRDQLPNEILYEGQPVNLSTEPKIS